MKRLLTVLLIMAITMPMYGENILSAIDKNNDAVSDIMMEVTMHTYNSNELISKKSLIMYQKGAERRIVFFTEPPEDRGLGFLSLPGGEMYMYLPAYSTTKRIASHVKNNSFAGTDFAYEDMESRKYEEWYDYAVLSETDSNYELELTVKENKETDYEQIIMTIDKAAMYPVKLKYYNAAGKHIKTMSSSNLSEKNGYVYAEKTTMTIPGSDNSSIMHIDRIEVNKGIGNDFFSTRTLERGL